MVDGLKVDDFSNFRGKNQVEVSRLKTSLRTGVDVYHTDLNEKRRRIDEAIFNIESEISRQRGSYNSLANGLRWVMHNISKTLSDL